MKRILLGILFITGLTIVACTKTTSVPRAVHNRVVGQYIFDKVTVSDGFLNYDNITDEYKGMILQLNDKKEAAIVDVNTGITYTGDWNVTAYQSSYTDDDGTTTDTDYFIDIYVSGGRGRIFHMEGRNAIINPHRMQFQVDRADGTYRYKLKKL